MERPGDAAGRRPADVPPRGVRRPSAARLRGSPARLLAAATVACSAILAGVAAASLLPADGGPGTAGRSADPLQTEVLRQLDQFTRWLRRHDVRGYVGEVGWPGSPGDEARAWNRIAEAWYARADAERLWVTAWATGTWFRPDYPLAVYAAGPDGLTPSEQASVVERHPSLPGVLRGVVVAGGEFGSHAATFSNADPGLHGRDYRFDPPETFAYLAGRGVSLVRLPFRWERVQPRVGEELDAAEVERLRRTVRSAHAAGLSVVLDLHNFGEYRLPGGSVRLGAEIDAATFADTWRRLATAFRGVPGVVGYGLMNEPAHVRQGTASTPERAWESLTQAAVDAIRGTGDGRVILVAGYPWSSVHDWGAHHPRPWIADPLDRVRYEAHHYWDGDHSGRYARSYADERAAAERRSRSTADARSSRPS